MDMFSIRGVMKHIGAAISYVLLFLFFSLIATSSLAEHQRTVSTYKNHIESNEHNAGGLDHQIHHMLFLTGIGDTFHFLNSEKKAAGETPFYCQPISTRLTGQDYQGIYESYIQGDDSPGFNSLTIPEALRLALQDKFPCP